MSENTEITEKTLSLAKDADRAYCNKEAALDRWCSVVFLTLVLGAMSVYSFFNDQREISCFLGVLFLPAFGIAVSMGTKAHRLSTQFQGLKQELEGFGQSAEIVLRHLRLCYRGQMLTLRSVARAAQLPESAEVTAVLQNPSNRNDIENALDHAEFYYRGVSIRSKGLKVYAGMSLLGGFWAVLQFMEGDISAAVMGVCLVILSLIEYTKVSGMVESLNDDLEDAVRPLRKLGLSCQYDASTYQVIPVIDSNNSQ